MMMIAWCWESFRQLCILLFPYGGKCAEVLFTLQITPTLGLHAIKSGSDCAHTNDFQCCGWCSPITIVGLHKTLLDNKSNNASEASYVNILTGQKLIKNAKISQFGEFSKNWSLRSNSVTRQVNLNRTKIGRICQNKKKSTMTFWVIFVYFCVFFNSESTLSSWSSLDETMQPTLGNFRSWCWKVVIGRF